MNNSHVALVAGEQVQTMSSSSTDASWREFDESYQSLEVCESIWCMKLRVSCHLWLGYLFFMCCFPRIMLIGSSFMNPMLTKIHVDSDRIAEYDMKLMGINSDTLAMSETEYKGVTAHNEFTRIVCHDLS